MTATAAAFLVAHAAAATRGVPRFQLYFDVIFNKPLQVIDKPPRGESPGDEQVARGVLRDAAGRLVGHFSSVCVYRTVVNGNAHERCSGSATTRDGTLRFAGPALQSDADHNWKLLGGTGRYRHATGHIDVHDLSNTETLVTGVITVSTGSRPRAGVIVRPRADARFIARADAICTRTHRILAKTPPFPYHNFDPFHPDPRVLPGVGRFFSGPGDGRPALRMQLAKLEALGRPPADDRVWGRYVRADRNAIRSIDAQIAAALSANVPGFVHTVKRLTTIYRHQEVTATIFGVLQCR